MRLPNAEINLSPRGQRGRGQGVGSPHLSNLEHCRHGVDEIGPVFWVLEMIGLQGETQLSIYQDVYRITFTEDESKIPASLKQITLFYMICIDEKAPSFAAILALPDTEALAEG